MKAVFWTDSTSFLKYIKNDTKRFQALVANRIGVIRESTDVNQWRHVSTKANPADYVSRGMTAEAFLKHDIWISGPQFLLDTEEHTVFWISVQSLMTIQKSILKGVLQHLKNKRKEVTANIQHKEKDQAKQELIESEMKAFKGTMGARKLALEDLKSAETAIVQLCQAHSFPEEVLTLQNESKSVKRQSSIFKLDPKLLSWIKE